MQQSINLFASKFLLGHIYSWKQTENLLNIKHEAFNLIKTKLQFQKPFTKCLLPTYQC